MVCSKPGGGSGCHVRWNVFASIRGLNKGERKQKGSNRVIKEVTEVKRETLKV